MRGVSPTRLKQRRNRLAAIEGGTKGKRTNLEE